MVFMEFKETMKLTEFGYGEELKFQCNGKNIKVMITLHSQKWILKTKLIKN